MFYLSFLVLIGQRLLLGGTSAFLGLLLLLGRRRRHLGRAQLIPVGERALLEARDQPHEVGERLVQRVAQCVLHFLVDEVQLREVGERDHVELWEKQLTQL